MTGYRAGPGALVLLWCAGCMEPEQRARGGAESEAVVDSPGREAAHAATASRWTVRPLPDASARFRPGGWSDEATVWGMIANEVTSFDVRTGETRGIGSTAWSVDAAPGVVSWRNEQGVWVRRDDRPAVLVAGNEPRGDFDGPPSMLWSPDGRRAILAWQGEWDASHALLEPNGALRELDTQIAGYFLDRPALWLDAERVLFETSALGPTGGEPSYRESGWRRDLAVLDLRSGAYRRVTGVSDLTHLMVAGPHDGQVLVVERDRAAARHWLYDPATWERRALRLPTGRAYPAPVGAIVVIRPSGDTATAVLVTSGDAVPLGRTAADAVPVFSPGGDRGVLRTAAGLVLVERADR